MARKVRIQYPKAVDHVMNRGDRRSPDLSGRLGIDLQHRHRVLCQFGLNRA